MIRILDTYDQINTLFNDSTFNYEKWVAYINAIYENSSHIFQDDMDEYITSGKYTFEKDFLPIINDVYHNPNLDILHESFVAITANLNEHIFKAIWQRITD